MKHPDSDLDKLIDYADRIGNGAVFKRLGFLAEYLQIGVGLAVACKARLTEGNALLDPTLIVLG